MRLVGVLFVAAIGLTSLSACVGTDRQADVYAGSGVGPTSANLPMPARVEATQRLTAVMPGELLFEPGRTASGVDPQTILTRSGALVAHAAFQPKRVTQAAHIDAQPVRTAEPGTSPRTTSFLAAQLTPGNAAPVKPAGSGRALTPLADVEARAAIEQQAQTNRDRRFDAQVKRASNLVCGGCLPAGRAARSRVPVPATEE